MRMTDIPPAPTAVPGPMRGTLAPVARTGTPLPKLRYYTVQNGDNLRALAVHFYGNPAEWVRIYNANMAGSVREDAQEGTIRNPNQIDAGSVLIIP